MTLSSRCRTDDSFVVRIPFSAERSSCNFNVVPLRSRVEPLASVAPCVRVTVPPLEVTFPALSCKGYGRFKSAPFVISCDPALSSLSAVLIVRSVVAEPSVSAKLLSLRPPISIGPSVEIFVLSFSIKTVSESVWILSKSLKAPPNSRVPPVKLTFSVPPLKSVLFKRNVLLFVIATSAPSINAVSYSFNSPPEICAAELKATEPPVKIRLELSRLTLPLNMSEPALDSIFALFCKVSESFSVKLPD